MNISQLRSESYRIFSRQTKENQKQNIESIQYIEMMASQVGVNVSHWQIDDIFRNPKKKRGTHLLADKNLINKALFERLEELGKDAEIEIAEIEKSVGDKLSKAYLTQKKIKCKALEQNRADYMAEAENYYSKYKDRLSAAWGFTKNIHEVMAQEDGLKNRLSQILRDGFWKFVAFEADKLLVFRSVGDIINTDINPAAGLNIRVNLGKFKVVINIGEMSLTVLKWENNIVVEQVFIHPHISRHGEVCWGTAKSTAISHLAKGEIDKVMALLAVLMQSYSNENPYRSLVAFDQVAKEMELEKKNEANRLRVDRTTSEVEDRTVDLREIVRVNVSSPRQVTDFDEIDEVLERANARESIHPYAAGASSEIHSGVLGGLQPDRIIIDDPMRVEAESISRDSALRNAWSSTRPLFSQRQREARRRELGLSRLDYDARSAGVSVNEFEDHHYRNYTLGTFNPIPRSEWLELVGIQPRSPREAIMRAAERSSRESDILASVQYAMRDAASERRVQPMIHINVNADGSVTAGETS